MACVDQITQQNLIDAKTDAITLGEVATSRAGAVTAGAPITSSTNRFGNTTDTVQGRLDKLGVIISDPIDDWTALTSITDMRAHRFPATTGDVYIPVKPLPFTTDATFNIANWVLYSGEVLQDRTITKATIAAAKADDSLVHFVGGFVLITYYSAGKPINAVYELFVGAGAEDNFIIHNSNVGGLFYLKLVQIDGEHSLFLAGGTVDGTADDRTALQLLKDTNVLASNLLVELPVGDVKLDTPITGILTAIKGRGIGSSFVSPPVDDYAFNMTNVSPSLLFSRIHDFRIQGDANFTGGKGIKIDPAFNTIIDNIHIQGLEEGITLVDSWVSKLESIRSTHVVNPIDLDTCNGSLISHFYAQRFKGNAIKHSDSLAPVMQALVMEFGEESATGLHLQGTHCAQVTGVYTEGEMGKDILLTSKNSGRALNTTLSGMWLNSGAQVELINVDNAAGITVRDVVMQTPQGTHMLSTPTAVDEMIYVTNVYQLDTNSNGFIGDQRDVGQTLIPICNDNRRVFMTQPSHKFGDGTQADLTNISSHTALDGRNVLPRLYKTPTLEVGASRSDADAASSSTTIIFGTGFYVAADNYGSCKMVLTGTMTNSLANQPSFKYQLNNATTGSVGEDAGNTSVPVSGDTITLERHVNLQPGMNLIQFGISREQGGGGTNTFACTLLSIL